jgi:RNA polymerase sigma-70 factor (ECF subfamily)
VIPDASTSPFAPTRWTLVVRAQGDSPEARAALSELCEAYYKPVFRFLRREGRDEDTARELTQEFFARILKRGDIGAADPGRGRFRSYVLGAVKHFLADQRDHDRRQKRGGGQTPESLDTTDSCDTSPALQVADPTGPTAEAFFDRQWALAVMDQAFNVVSSDFTREGKKDQFDALKPWLVGDTERLSQAEVALHLGWSETAVKVAVHRLRKRFREAVRLEIAQTLADGADIDDELRYLVLVLSDPH